MTVYDDKPTLRPRNWFAVVMLVLVAAMGIVFFVGLYHTVAAVAGWVF